MHARCQRGNDQWAHQGRTNIVHTWKRMAASTASTLSLKSKGTSADRVMAILSSRCSLRGPSSGLNVAISSGRHLQEAPSAADITLERHLYTF